MSEIIQFLIALFIADPVLQAAFVAAGASSVTVLSPQQRINAAYPRLIIDGDLGSQSMYGDVLPQFFSGSINIEAVARKNDASPTPVNETPLATVTAIQNRIQQLMLGNPVLHIPSLQGTVCSANYRIDSIGQRYSRLLPKEDSSLERYGSSYHLFINNYSV